MWEIDGYTAGPELGRDNLGVVARARDILTGSDVAIRYLPREISGSPEFMARLRTGLTALQAMEHPNLALVYELSETGGGAALVTEFVDGPSVDDVLRQAGPLPPGAAVVVATEVLAGLSAMHRHGVLHRGIRPGAIRLGRDDVVKLVDIGLPSGAAGPYRAPELQRGEPESPASDIFAVFAVLLTCLSGRDGQPGAAGLPPELRAALSIGLADRPEARYPNADMALVQLRALAATIFGADWAATGRQALQRRAMTRDGGADVTAVLPAIPGLPPQPAAASLANRTAPAPRAFVAPPAAPGPAFAAQRAAETTMVLPAPVRPLAPAGSPSIPLQAAPVSPAGPAGPPPPVGAPPPWPWMRRRSRWIVAAAVAALLVAGATTWAVLARHSDDGDPGAVTTNVRVPLVLPTPTVPVAVSPGAGGDLVPPSAPAGLRVTGRSTTAVSLSWAPSVDNVGIAGYIVLRDGRRVGTTYDPGFDDSGLTPQTRYTYSVAAFDDAGNISGESAAVTAITLATPDLSPPTIPTGLGWTGRSTNSIVLAWAPSQDNVGVAGYEVYRDGVLIANVTQPGFTDTGLEAASSHTYRIRAYDSSNNASADSAPLTVATLQAPDTTPPSTPTGLGAIATGPDTIDLSWQPSQDNIGVAGYQLFRDGVKVADVAGTLYTDPGLTPDTTYAYAVRAVDAAGNASGLSATATAHTNPAPTPTVEPTTNPPTGPAPEILSVSVSATPIAGCKVHVEALVMASAPMQATLTYSVNLNSGSIPLTFTESSLTQVVPLPDGDALLLGSATASVGGHSDTAGWLSCILDPPG